MIISQMIALKLLAGASAALPSTDEIFPLYYRTLITDTVVNTTFISAQSVASVLVTDKVISSATINGNTFASVRIP